MKPLLTLFNQIMAWLPRRRSRPQDIPKKLDAAALAKAMEEARFLASQAVNVRDVPKSESSQAPRRADE